ncbi:MAG: MauE/DoxX family redox-associated membrane protein [Nostocoides sp.]
MTFLAVAPLVLAGVLLLSGYAKWRDRYSTRSVIANLRLPRAFAKPWVGVALPAGEGALALGLLTPWAPIYLAASWLTLALMLTYAALVARAMRFDPRPSCGCFGKIGDQRINGRTVTRNVIFVVLAVAAVGVGLAGDSLWSLLAAPGGSAAGWLAASAVVGVVVWFVAAGSTTASSTGTAVSPAAPPPGGVGATAVRPPSDAVGGAVQAISDQEVLDALDRDNPDYVRRPIPMAYLVGRAGEVTSLPELARSKPVLLVATNCFCGTTALALESMSRWRAALPFVDVHYVTTLPFQAHQRPEVAAPEDGWYDHEGRAWYELGLGESPSAVLLGADGLLAGGPVGSVPGIDEFVEDIAAELDSFDPGELPAYVPPPAPLMPDGSEPFAWWTFNDGRVIPVTREQLMHGELTMTYVGDPDNVHGHDGPHGPNLLDHQAHGEQGHNHG